MVTMTMLLLAAILTVFVFLCVARTTVSWFAPSVPRVGRLEKVLAKATDWYLGLFRGKRCLRLSSLDFGPALGILVAILPATALWTLGRDGRLGIWAILAVLLSSLWTAVAFLLGSLILLLVIRVVLLAPARKTGGASPASGAGSRGAGAKGAQDALESLTDPVAKKLAALFGTATPRSPRRASALAAFVLVVLLAVGSLLVWGLGQLLYRIS